MPDKIPLTEEQVSAWRGEISRAIEQDKQVSSWWEANLKAYAPGPAESPVDYGSRVNTNRDFTLVERKKADLFYQRPDVACQPSPLFMGQEPLLDTHSRILNEKLGLDGVNAKRLVHEALFDVLCPVGTAWTFMGYESTVIPTETVDPVTGEPTTVPVPIHENCFWKHIPPKQRLKPASFRSTNWDEAPWLGHRFEIPARLAKRMWDLPEDFKGGQPDAQQHFDYGVQLPLEDEVVSGAVVYYKSAIYRDDIQHPLHLTKLVILDADLPDPVVEHRDAPEQSFDQTGKLTADSLVGFPYHPLTIRVLTDTADVPSDCAISRPLVNELNRFREQMVEQRDANTLRYAYNTDVLPRESVEKIVRAPIGGLIGIPGEAFVGDGAIKELPHGSYPRENFTFNDYLDNDLARTHAIDANQAGTQSSESKTATETQIQQANVNARLDLERGIVMDWYIRGVTKYSTLLQRFMPVRDAAEIVGAEAAQAWDAWRKQVPAALAFTAQPDSALRTDLAWERKRTLDEYTFFANDPWIDRGEFLRSVVAPKLHFSPKVVLNQPPPKQAESAKPTFSFKGEDLNPLAPQFAIVMDILKQTGVQISPAALSEAQGAAQNSLLLGQAQAQNAAVSEQNPNEQHGGKVAQMEGLSKHQTDETGGLQGSGEPAAMGAGGMVQ